MKKLILLFSLVFCFLSLNVSAQTYAPVTPNLNYNANVVPYNSYNQSNGYNSYNRYRSGYRHGWHHHRGYNGNRVYRGRSYR